MYKYVNIPKKFEETELPSRKSSLSRVEPERAVLILSGPAMQIC